MWEFNLVVTLAEGGRFRHLLQELAPHGDFRRTEFLGVILGQVADPQAFLETVAGHRARQLIAFSDLGRVIPVARVFLVHVGTFVGDLCRELHPWLDDLAGRRFYVRLERRGHKGEIVSPEAERAIDAWLLGELEARGTPGAIDYDDPDAVVVIETVGDRCGLALLTRELRRRYLFVRVS